MLLHEENHRPEGRELKPGLARHYYDLWCLITKGVATQAVAHKGLFEQVATHRQGFFRHSWMDYDTLKKGSLEVVPRAAKLGEWRRDYRAMREEMFFSEPPDLDEVLEVVGRFQGEFNRV